MGKVINVMESIYHSNISKKYKTIEANSADKRSWACRGWSQLYPRGWVEHAEIKRCFEENHGL